MSGKVQATKGDTTNNDRNFSFGIWLLCGLVLLVSSLDLVGWWTHLPTLIGPSYGFVTMKPNTALMLFLLALAVLAKQGPGSRWAPVGSLLSVGVLAIALATLLEYASGRSFGIDQVLAHVPAEAAGDPVGRMSQGSAMCGAFAALALLLVETPTLGGLLASLAALLCLSALVGYLFDAGPLLGVRLLRSMAPRTAGSFLLLQIAFFLLRPWREPTRSLLYSARHHRFGAWYVLGTCMLPLLVGLPIATLYRRGWFQAPFAFAVLVVLLVGAQAVLVSRNSRSLALVEGKRAGLEHERMRLAEENQQQYANLLASQERAEQNEAQFRLIANALPAMVSYLDRDMRYVRVNRTYEEWFGRAAAEIEGRRPEEILGPAAPDIRRHLRASLRGEPQQFETQLETLQGERTVSITQIPDTDDQGQVRGVIVQANDITARKQAEAALRQTEKLAAVGKLASSIAHEINNPLEAVTNLLYLAGTTDSLPEIKFHIETAEQELARVSAIANQTLRFHRQASSPVKVTANDLLETVMAIYQGRLHAQGIRIEQKHAPAKPITCMDGEIRQVLNNLVGNALDAMQGTPGRLLLRSHNATDWTTGRRGLVLTVADTGAGMSAATRKALFEAFFTTKGVSGTGLGLWVSKEIVDRHLGRLSLRSSQAAAHHGTVFRLFLPENAGVLAA